MLGFDDPRVLRMPHGRPIFYQPDPTHPDGYLLPYRLNTKISAAQAIPSTSHAWLVQHSGCPARSTPTAWPAARR